MTTDHTPSRNCYLRGCRQPGCVQEDRRYTKRLRMEHERGQYRMTNAAQTRHHIERLMAAGWTQRQIAHASRVEAASIHQIYVGAQEKTANWRAAAILAVPITPPPTNPRRVDATGSRRRLQALRAIGHRRYDLAASLGITADRIKHITNNRTLHVAPTEAAAIARLYRRLSTVPGPSKQTAGVARSKGWHGPLAWDDIDDPNAEPETDKPYKPAAKYRRDPLRKAEIEHLYLCGESIEVIAKKLGNTEKYVEDRLADIRHERAEQAEQERAATRLGVTRQHLQQELTRHPEASPERTAA